MINRYVLFIIIILLGSNLQAQDFSSDYQVLVNKGDLPIDLLSSSTQKYRQRKKSIEKNDNRKTKKAKNKFYLESSFVIDELFHSGKILFSDPEITEYLHSVADEILKDDPSLRKKIRIYTIKSSAVNAFSTDRGAIFFTLGLLAKLNTEAELAFILSHEIAHYTEKHSINSAVTFDKINRKGKRLRKKLSLNKNANSYDPLLNKSNYSKANEEEADLLGGKRFLKSAYRPSAIIDAFDILEFAHVPLSNDSLATSFLDLDGLTIPARYLLKNIDPPSPMENQEYSTHPNVDARRKLGKKLLQSTNKKEGKDFIVSKSLFKTAKTTAQFELCDVLLQEFQYPDAIYHSSVLLKKYPNNRFLKWIKAYALYGLAQYVNANREEEVIRDYQDAEGNITLVYKATEKLSNRPANINLVAARYCWDYHEAYPEDKAMELALRDQVEDLVIFGLEEPEGYFSNSKFKKSNPKKDFGRLAFAKIHKNKDFKKMLADGARYKKEMNEESKKKKKKKVALGLKKVVFVNPAYYRVDLKRRSNNELKYIYSESRQKEFEKLIKRNARRVHLNAQIIDSHRLTSRKKSESFNDFSKIRRFQEELLHHNMYMIASNFNEVQPLVKKYKTAAFVNMGNISIRKKPGILTYPTAVLLAMPPTTYKAVKKAFANYEGMQYAYVFDISTNRILHREFATYKQKDIKPLIEMNTYNLLYRLAAKKK